MRPILVLNMILALYLGLLSFSPMNQNSNRHPASTESGNSNCKYPGHTGWFAEAGTLACFETLHESSRPQVISEMLSANTAGQVTQAGAVLYPDKDLILKKYFENMDREYKSRVYKSVVENIDPKKNPELLQKYIQLGAKTSPDFAKDYLCPKFERWAEEGEDTDYFDRKELQKFSNEIAEVWSLFSHLPGASDAKCSFDSDDGTQLISIGEMVTMSRDTSRVASTDSVRATFQCTAEQAKTLFHRSLQTMLHSIESASEQTPAIPKALKKKRVPQRQAKKAPVKKKHEQLMIAQDGGCRIEGYLVRDELGQFYFYPSTNLSDRTVEPIRFYTLNELLDQFQSRFRVLPSSQARTESPINEASTFSRTTLISPLSGTSSK